MCLWSVVSQPKIANISPLFSFRSFVVWGYILISMIYFQLFFLCTVRHGSSFFFIVIFKFFEKIFLLDCLCNLVISIDHRSVDLCVVPLFCLLTLQKYHSHDYYILIMHFKVRLSESSSVALCKNYFCYSSSFAFLK